MVKLNSPEYSSNKSYCTMAEEENRFKAWNEGGNSNSEDVIDISVMNVDVSSFASPTNLINVTVPSETRISDSSMKTMNGFTCKKLLTPRVKLATRAVSSTPNQELFNSSKITRHVSSQTIFTHNTQDSGELSNELKSICLQATHGEETNDFSFNTLASISVIVDTPSPPRYQHTGDQQHSEEKKKPVALNDMSLDTSSGASSIMPSSQDTGYQTQMEESSQTSPHKQYHHDCGPSVTASTPTHRHRL